MQPRLIAVGRWLHRRAENVLALLLAVMFVAFLVQILARYVFNFPIGWTTELSLIAWLWLVLWGAAFVISEREEIRFDLLRATLGRRGRIVAALVSGVFLVILYALSLPAVTDYVLFMRVQETAYLDIRFDWLYSIYPVFAVAVIVRYGWLIRRALLGRTPASSDPTDSVSGL